MRNDRFGWGCGAWLNLHHKQNISLQEHKLTLLVFQPQALQRGVIWDFFPFYVKSIAKGRSALPWPKYSLLPLHITCYHDLVNWVLHALHSGLTVSVKLGKRWQNFLKRGGSFQKKNNITFPKLPILLLHITYKKPLNYSCYISQNLVSKMCWFRPTPNRSVCPQGGPLFLHYSPIKVH